MEKRANFYSHALARRDIKRVPYQGRFGNFYSHALARRDGRYRSGRGEQRNFYSHALARRDGIDRGGYCDFKYFYSHALARRDREQQIDYNEMIISTPTPSQGVTHAPNYNGGLHQFLLPRPRKA